MIKTVFWTLRVPDALDEITRNAAEKRGMNLSEYVRYVLTRHFDDDYAPNGGKQTEPENGSEGLS